jgi:thiol-disulfide isomerase/thioredoxin
VNSLVQNFAALGLALALGGAALAQDPAPQKPAPEKQGAEKQTPEKQTPEKQGPEKQTPEKPADAKVAQELKQFGPRLRIGDPAPALKLGAWIKGEPVTEFEKDRVYVVEFWATWCVPCKKSIPHLSAIQQKFAPRGVTLIAVSVYEDDQRRVKPFVDELGPAMDYRVATDLVPPRAKPGYGHMALKWLRDAFEQSLPTAFIVDGGGRIAWIGNSLEIDTPLQQVVDGTWDLDVAKARNEKRVKVNQLTAQLKTILPMKVSREAKLDWKQALAVIDELCGLDASREYEIAPYRFNVLLQLDREAEGYAYAKKFAENDYKDDALKLNWLSWVVVDPDMPRHPHRDLDFAMQLAKRADELSQHKNPAIMDTLALVYFETGDVDHAIVIQEQAVKLAEKTDYLEDLTKRLEKFKAAKTDAPPPEANRRSNG